MKEIISSQARDEKVYDEDQTGREGPQNLSSDGMTFVRIKT